MNYFSAPGIFKSEVTLSFILKTVCEMHGVEESEIRSSKRDSFIVQARKIFSFAARKYVKSAPFREIGEYISRDHATAMHHIRDVKSKISINDSITIHHVEKIEGVLNPIKWANIHAENITNKNNKYGRI